MAENEDSAQEWKSIQDIPPAIPIIYALFAALSFGLIDNPGISFTISMFMWLMGTFVMFRWGGRKMVYTPSEEARERS